MTNDTRWLASLALLVASAGAGCTSPNPDYDPPRASGPQSNLPNDPPAVARADATVDTSPEPDAPCAIYYRDEDGDGFGDAQVSLRWCDGAPPAGYVARAGDCDDGDARAFPGQTRAFDEERVGGGWDFDCDGKATRVEVGVVQDCQRTNTGCVGGGWFKPLPQCGQQGKRMSCEIAGYEGGKPICKAAYHYAPPPCR